MIVYDLKCINDHTFEGWFEDSDAYHQQEADGRIECPICNTTSVFKLPSAFAIKSSQTVHPTPAKQDSHYDEIKKLGQRFSEFVENNFDNVGADFSKEALKIHYGVSEPRNIRGSSTQKEEKILKDEGIEFIKLPMIASDEKN